MRLNNAKNTSAESTIKVVQTGNSGIDGVAAGVRLGDWEVDG